jgi:hypothetical protein
VGRWAVGQLAVGSRPWEAGRGSAGRGKRAVGSGPWEVGRGKWAVGSGPWEVGHVAMGRSGRCGPPGTRTLLAGLEVRSPGLSMFCNGW